jgi:hypothetical protein
LIPGKYRYSLHAVDNANNWNDDDYFFTNYQHPADNQELLSPLTGQVVIDLPINEWGCYYGVQRPDGIYFVGYAKGLIKDESEYGMFRNNRISKVLLNNQNEQILNFSEPLVLAQGYQLSLKSVDINGIKIYLELSKNGEIVDSKVVQPSIEGATVYDKTYNYRKAVSDPRAKPVIIAVHFMNAIRGATEGSATVDCVFQISDEPLNADGQSTDYSFIEVQIM